MSSIGRRTRARPQTTAVAEKEAAAPEAQPSNAMLSGVMSSRRTRQKMSGTQATSGRVMGGLRSPDTLSTESSGTDAAAAQEAQAGIASQASGLETEQLQALVAKLQIEQGDSDQEAQSIRLEIQEKLQQMQHFQGELQVMLSIEEQAESGKQGKGAKSPQMIAMFQGRAYIPSPLLMSIISGLQQEIAALALELSQLEEEQEERDADLEAQQRLLMLLLGTDSSEV